MDTTQFEINTGIIKGDSVAFCLLITILEYALRNVVNEEEGQPFSSSGVETPTVRCGGPERRAV